MLIGYNTLNPGLLLIEGNLGIIVWVGKDLNVRMLSIRYRFRLWWLCLNEDIGSK